MTKFINSVNKPKELKKTVFKSVLINGSFIAISGYGDYKPNPHVWDNVELISGANKHQGDLFKCWMNRDSDTITYFFGIRGDEFD